MLERLSHLDGRVVYAILLVSMIVPLVKPLGLPLTTPPETQALYELLEALPEGTPIVISMDTSPGGFDELSPGTTAVMSHAARKGLRVIGVAFWDAGPSLLQKIFAASLMNSKEYGKDYVNLGYVAGGENAMAAVARDIKAMYPKDFQGKSTEGMSVLDGVTSLSDVKLVICVASGNPGVPEWIRQVGDALHVPIATVVIAGLVADYAPYVQSRQLVRSSTWLVRGAAGYEALVGMLGRGTAGIDAQSVAHLAILILVVVGNIVYFGTRAKGEGKGGKA